MKEIIKSTIADTILEKLKKYIEEMRQKKQWHCFFVDTGAVLTHKLDANPSFEEDLFLVFSDDNMQELSKEMINERGYNFKNKLHEQLYDLMIRYEIDDQLAETYIHHFMQAVLSYLEKNDPEKALEAYLASWKEEEAYNFLSIESQLTNISNALKDLSQSRVVSYSISDIDTQIRRCSKYKGMSLDFFELDDDQFAVQFSSAINKSCIYVVGKSREETLYRILNEIKNHYPERVTIIIKSGKEWNHLSETGINGKILIPFFFAGDIVAIPNNTNIFIYCEDEPCYQREKLLLHKRTISNITSSLKNLGINSTEAYRLMENTHGLYAPLRKRLFNGAIHEKPVWLERPSDTVIAALLCGKWSSNDGDRLVFEELSGKSYEDSIKELEEYSRGENPYIISYRMDFQRKSFQLSCVEDAWEELDTFISEDKWKEFITLFYEVLIESEPIFEYPFEKHFEAQLYASKPDWSSAIKSGMIRSLIMRAYYRGHDQDQIFIDSVIKRILDTITTKERWGYISQYLTDLCEASPSSVIDRLEKELEQPSGMIEVFADNQGDILTSRNYYTNILWAIEYLLQQKKYVTRALQWLWKMNELSITYKISNSPEFVLKVVFCAWLNTSALTVQQKIDAAKNAVHSYKNAWDIIEAELPSKIGSSCMPLSMPKYRAIDEPDDLFVKDINDTYYEYLLLCVDTSGNEINRWGKLLDHLYNYEKSIQERVLTQLVSTVSGFDDIHRINIKNKIRSLIHRHRYFRSSNWSVDEGILHEYEKAMNAITTCDPVYEYIYLFYSQYDFPLLNPVPYEQESFSENNEKNQQLMNEEITEKLKDFREKKHSLEKLVKLVLMNENNNLGEVLAKYYCEGSFDTSVLELLAKEDNNGNQVLNYIRVMVANKAVGISEILSTIKRLTENDELLCDIISMQPIENRDQAIIFHEKDSIKKIFWSRTLRYPLSNNADETACLTAINECYRYGSIASYIELLYSLRERITIEQLFDFFIRFPEIKEFSPNALWDYYMKQILQTLQQEYLQDDKKRIVLSQIEWSLVNILEWDQMKCVQYEMKKDPHMYAELVSIIYKHDEDDTLDEEKAKLASRLYKGFMQAKFCPTEDSGNVSYEELKAWILTFKELLKKQKQERLWGHLTGKLLAYSPIDQDGFMPCKAVRRIIEEYSDDDMESSYASEEFNKRGVYSPDGGKSELRLSENYKKNAEALQYKYPHTAKIYFSLSDSYRAQSECERENAENV